MIMNVYYLVCITMSVMQNAVYNCELKFILTYLTSYSGSDIGGSSFSGFSSCVVVVTVKDVLYVAVY